MRRLGEGNATPVSCTPSPNLSPKGERSLRKGDKGDKTLKMP